MKRYFRAVEGGCVTFSFVADDLEHAKQILANSGTEIEHELEWSEITAEQAATIRVHDEDVGESAYRDPTLQDRDRGVPLDQFAVGNWFCSEY